MWNKHHLHYLTTKVIKKNMDSSKNYVFLQSVNLPRYGKTFFT